MIANHASTRTTQLYDRRSDAVSLDEVERILISPLLTCYKRARQRQPVGRARRRRRIVRHRGEQLGGIHMRGIAVWTVAGVAFSCLSGIAMAQAVPAPKGIPDLKGKWVETGERSGVVRRGNRWEHKSPPTNGEVVFGGPLTWSLTVERQEGVVFSGTWASQNNTDAMVGAVSADGRTLYLADDNGPMHGELRGPDQMEICRSLAERDRMLAFCRIFERRR